MGEVCTNGHPRTLENTSLVKCGRGEKRKPVCLDCRRSRNTGKPTAADLTAQRTTELHENIEDLLDLCPTLAELVERAGFSSLKRLKESLRRRGRDDLLRQIETKGESTTRAKITDVQVLEIRASSASSKEIQTQYGLSRSSVWAIRNRKSWGHLPDF